MTTEINGTGLATRNSANIIETVIAKGDLSQLSPDQRVSYYREVCRSIGLNELTRPFEYIVLNNRLTLYARKDATDQLRSTRGVSITKLERDHMGDIYAVTAYATDSNGRQDSAIGAVSISGLRGESLANALMKAETKAKRRVTLSLCGLGWTDESEVESIPSAQTVVVDSVTGEILDTRPANPPEAASHQKPSSMVTSTDDPMWDRWLKLKSQAESLGVFPREIVLPIGRVMLQSEGAKVRGQLNARRAQLASEDSERAQPMVTSKSHQLWKEWLEVERKARDAGLELDTSNVRLPLSEESLQSSTRTLQEALTAHETEAAF